MLNVRVANEPTSFTQRRWLTTRLVRTGSERRVLRRERVRDDDEHFIECGDCRQLRGLRENANIEGVGHDRDATRTRPP